jgi:hypothetical protein
MDPRGGADLLVEVNTSGLAHAFRQRIAAGTTNLSFTWDADLPDAGAWHDLTVPVLVTFWDEDLAGNDAQSGVQRQPLRLSESCANPPLCNALPFEVAFFARTWTLAGQTGSGTAALQGPDGGVTLDLAPRAV